MNRKNYGWAESSFLMRPRFRVGFGLTSSGSGRVQTEPTRPDSISDSVASAIVAPLVTRRTDKRNVVVLIFNLSISGYSGKNY